MKVLLLHEMSGVHTELKKGLTAIGVEAKIATFGDGWKQYGTDIALGNLNGFARGSISKTICQLRLVRHLSNFDVIQCISPTPFFRPLNRILVDQMQQSGADLFYIAAGSDAVYRKHVRDLPYYPPHDWYENERQYSDLDYLLKQTRAIIPVCYEYEFCMKRDGRNPHKVIPFPIDVLNHTQSKLAQNQRIRIFHPLNRLNPRNDFKGSKMIKDVFDRLSSKFHDVAEFIIAGGLPHQEYDELTNSVDIIVDQTNGMSYGMSAALGLAKGKVVLSGNENITKVYNHYQDCPVINITPDPKYLERQLEELLLNRSSIRELGEKSRLFAEEHHDHKKVARKYLEAYVMQSGR
jgi:glycosyltransferase involved in cell wall biosynthesis